MRVVITGWYGFNEKDQPKDGTQSHTHNLINHLSKISKLDLHILVKGFTNVTVVRKNITIHVLKFPLYIYLPVLSHILFALRLRREIKRVDPDLIHYHGTSPYPLLVNINPCILTVFGIFAKEAKTRWSGCKYILYGLSRILMERIVLRKIPFLIAISNYVKTTVSKMSSSYIRVILEGADEDFFVRNENLTEKNRILCVGVIDTRKGLLDLVKAFEKVKKHIPNAKLIMVGAIKDRKYYHKICKYIEKHKIADVEFKGYLEKYALIREYKKCSVYVHTSMEESLCIAILEAMASGKPVIAYEAGGMVNSIQENETGYLVSRGDVLELSQKIIKVLKDDEIRRKMGRNGRNRAIREFRWEKIAKETYKYYEEVLTGKAVLLT